MEEEKGVQMEWVGHLGKAFESFINDLKGVLPEETYNHLRASRKELLMAIRSVIDREIERADKEGQPKVHKVEVQ
jgi:hypothetical protein